MARLWQSGFELNSTTTGVEWTATLNSPSVQSTIARSGTYAGRVTSPSAAAAKAFQYTFAAANGNGPYFVRVWIRFDVFPNADSRIISLLETGGTQPLTVLFVNATNKLRMEYNDAATAITGDSPAMQLKQWYRLEFKFDKSPAGGSQAILAILTGPGAAANGTIFGNASNLTITNGVNQLQVGVNNENDSATACDIYYDDIAINDSTGSSQTSYPGDGAIVHLKPSAAGDSNGFTVQVGGTAGSANNFTRVNENTPDDATSYNGAALLNAEDLFNVDNFTGGAFSSINVVAVGTRMADLVAGDATTGVKLEIEKTGSGTKSQSANLIPNSTSFLTNTAAAPRNYPLVTYNDPDGVPWGQSTLDSMQIGYINDTVGVQTVAVSTVWVSVDYTAALIGGTSTSTSSTSTSSTSISSTSTSLSSTSSSISTSSTSSTSSSISTTSTSLSTSSTSSSISSTSSSISSTSSSTSSTSTSSTSSSTSISSTSSSISSTSTSSTSTSSTSSSTSYSSTSTSYSSTSSSLSSTSLSISSTSASSTSSSSSTSTTTLPPPYLDYTYDDKASLPTAGTDLPTHFNSVQYGDESVDDGDYFIEYGSEFIIENFQRQFTNNTGVVNIIWKGRSTYSSIVSPIYLQIYNQNSASWETLDYDNTKLADTDYVLNGLVSTNLSNYYDSTNTVTCRVYQQVI